MKQYSDYDSLKALAEDSSVDSLSEFDIFSDDEPISESHE